MGRLEARASPVDRTAVTLRSRRAGCRGALRNADRWKRPSIAKSKPRLTATNLPPATGTTWRCQASSVSGLTGKHGQAAHETERLNAANSAVSSWRRFRRARVAPPLGPRELSSRLHLSSELLCELHVVVERKTMPRIGVSTP